jgi:hypothetical protein
MMSDSPTLPFVFSVSYSFSEWVRILRDAEVRNLRYWLNNLIGLAFLLIGLYEITLGIWLLRLPGPTARQDAIWNILYGVPLIIFVLVVWLDLVTLIKVRLAFKRREKIGAKIYEFKFGEQEASFASQDNKGKEEVTLSWNNFSSVSLGKTAVILRTIDGGMWAIPLRVFMNSQSAQSFKQFVELRIKESKASAKTNSG